jgi:hypothetical protein
MSQDHTPIAHLHHVSVRRIIRALEHKGFHIIITQPPNTQAVFRLHGEFAGYMTSGGMEALIQALIEDGLTVNHAMLRSLEQPTDHR